MRRGFDVLYLVCHGYVVGDEPVLLLVDEDGHAAPLLGSELIGQLRDLSRLPRLVFLASCQSAGAGADRRSEDAGVLAALGPRLAEVGVPAVVAMQGNITMTTAAAFTKAFFKSLDEDGLVDRATAVARAAVRDRPDWWVPALFMRLKSGRLWYLPGTAPGGERFDKWPSLITDLKVGKCTPVIGPGHQRRAAGHPAGDRHGLGPELPVPHGAAQPGEPAAGRPVPVGQPGPALPGVWS